MSSVCKDTTPNCIRWRNRCNVICFWAILITQLIFGFRFELTAAESLSSVEQHCALHFCMVINRVLLLRLSDGYVSTLGTCCHIMSKWWCLVSVYACLYIILLQCHLSSLGYTHAVRSADVTDDMPTLDWYVSGLILINILLMIWGELLH